MRVLPPGRSYRPLAWLVACIVAILVGDLLAARYIQLSRREATRTALLDVRVDLLERARSLEAALRSARSGLEFIAGVPSIAFAPGGMRSKDPTVVRFKRQSVEGDLIRYLETHSEIERAIVRDGDGRAVVAVGRRASSPVLLPLQAADIDVESGRLRASIPLPGGEGVLEAHLNPASLFSSQATGTGRAVLLGERGEPLAGDGEAFRSWIEAPATLRHEVLANADTKSVDGWAISAVRVKAAGFEPAPTWTLVRCEREDALIAALLPLLAGYRTTFAFHILGLLGTLALGATAVRLALRRARLEEAAAQEAQLRALETRLHDADRMAAVGRTAATLAHEVRNPLEGMKNWLALADHEARSLGAEGVLRYTSKVRDGIAMVAEVVRRVLEMSAPSGKGFQEIDLNVVVKDTLAMVEGTPAFSGVTLVTQLPTEPLRLRGDRVLLGQLLLNLVLNARDAMPHGGTLRVVTETSGGEMRLLVRDSGPGIEEAAREKLFEMGTSTKGSTGIGLALCARVARVHGGTLEAANAPEGGAVFTLRLPDAGASTPAIEGLAS
jgi:signal transduction histidine kinase